ncbi:MAG: hypothetical protein KC506_03570 [Nanoarchaeota archaeon]|nr:hypothetical protein [Nanoarchaeota archaeon]
MRRRPSPTRIAVSEVISIVLLVVGVLILNLVAKLYFHPTFLEIVDFFNVNLIFLILLSLVFFVGDLFAMFGLPVNLPAPFFRAIASTLLAAFIIRVLRLVESVAGMNVFGYVYGTRLFIYALVFFLVLIFGYINIFTAVVRRKEGKERREVKKLKDYRKNGTVKEAVIEEKKVSKKTTKKKN